MSDNLSWEVPRLDAHLGPYRFTLVAQGHGWFVWIPGTGGGRDGPTDPDHPEQQAWMRAQSGLTERWYLTWEVPDVDALEAFRARLERAAGVPVRDG